MVEGGAGWCRGLEDDGPDEAEGTKGERAAFRPEAAGREAYLLGVAEGGKEEEVAVAELIGVLGTEGVIAELLVNVAVAPGQFEKMRVGVVHESPAVLFPAGIEQDEREKGCPDEGVCKGVAHGRDCGGEECGGELEIGESEAKRRKD